MTEIIKLNVNGTPFQTQKSTLIQFEFFKSLFERWSSDSSNEIFVDTDPELFKHLLNLIKIPEYEIPKSLKNNVLNLANYYGLNCAINLNKISKIYLQQKDLQKWSNSKIEINFDRLLALNLSFQKDKNISCF